MKCVDVTEVIVTAIEKTIIKEWRHEGFIGGFSSTHANFEIDGKEYVLTIREVADGEHWSDILDGEEQGDGEQTDTKRAV